jgi:cytochrome oxidase Cu insertion factor (SCO1/SenC/PrrC family)
MVTIKSPIQWILMTVLLAVVFCFSFAYFFTKQHSEQAYTLGDVEKKKEMLLPEARLVDLDSEVVPDDNLRKGKVVLVFISPSCNACHTY